MENFTTFALHDHHSTPATNESAFYLYFYLKEICVPKSVLIKIKFEIWFVTPQLRARKQQATFQLYS